MRSVARAFQSWLQQPKSKGAQAYTSVVETALTQLGF